MTDEPTRVGEKDTVTLRRADYEALLDRLEDAEDRAALLEHRLGKASGRPAEMLTLEEEDRLIDGENPVRFWREKRGYSVRGLAAAATGIGIFLTASMYWLKTLERRRPRWRSRIRPA